MKIFEFIPEGVNDGNVRAWLHEYPGNDIPKRKRPAIVICPGGAYRFVSEREAEPVAMVFYAAGYNTFILNYAVMEQAKNFYPLCQLASTFAHIRKYAEEWSIDANKIAVCGFSAGGHLAASLGTLFNEEKFLKVFKRAEHIRPDAMILGYPVITADKYTHVESLEYVSGSKFGSDECTWFGLEQHVDEQTPPAFLWHTAEDQAVPVENSLKFVSALSAAKVPYELHILPKGAHGMSVCTKEVEEKEGARVYDEIWSYNARWTKWCIQWLNELFDFTE